MITKKQLQEDLERMGIRSTDTVAIHTSLRAAGPIEGGAESFIEAFTDYLSDGLLVVPTHTWKTVNQENPVFDVRSSEPCVGIVPTIAAFHPKAVRSMHATHSVAVFGKRAAEYAANDNGVITPTPAEGCFGRLYDEKAKILLIGVGQERNTFIHAVEEIVDVPQRLTEPFEVTLIHKDGHEEKRMIHKHYNPICAHISENFVKFDPFFAECGAVTQTKLGNAAVKLCDAVKVQEEVIRLWNLADWDLTVDLTPLPKSWKK
ncbi:MAG: AAC(3) family N-acetyltransferase [Firmicutes bacterium]|nr:AAC(3) family N-acetyltransferase [Bacillota bacterium]